MRIKCRLLLLEHSQNSIKLFVGLRGMSLHIETGNRLLFFSMLHKSYDIDEDR